MDIILLLIGAYWLSGILGCRRRKRTPRRRKKLWWYDSSYADWEQHQKCNGR